MYKVKSAYGTFKIVPKLKTLVSKKGTMYKIDNKLTKVGFIWITH